jgi:hypothetical protein
VNYAVVDSLWKKKPKDVEFVYADTLARKLLQHSLSAYVLWTRHTRATIPGVQGEIELLDWPSIEVLARACTETYLAFHYLYIDAKSDDEFQFRYCAWMLAGFTKRESFPTITEKGLQQVARDAKANEKNRRRIQTTARFQGLKPRAQRWVLEGRGWHPETTLSSMAKRIYGPQWGSFLYSLMSSHAHSDALSAVQIKQSQDPESVQHLADAAISQIGLVLARMTADYADKFVKAGKTLAQHPYRKLNEAYANFGQDFPAIIEERRRALQAGGGEEQRESHPAG